MPGTDGRERARAWMRLSAILITDASSEPVDEVGFLEAQKDGDIPCEAGLPNLVVTPHVAGGRRDAMQFPAYRLADNGEAFVAGRQLDMVQG